MINKVILVGRLGKDVEFRHTQEGNMVASFSLATSKRGKTKTGEKIDKTEWHNIVVFGSLAEICCNYLKKGSLIYIEGEIQTRKYVDKNGNEKSTTNIIMNEMVMLDKKSQEPQGTPVKQTDINDVPF